MQEVSALCDEIVIVARGKAIAHGTPAELCRSAGEDDLEEAFVRIIGTDEGLQ
jgi:sodium transport system ATP-binding protein